MIQTAICVDQRFNGPPGIANGGYICGMVAEHNNSPVEVTLRRPTPLEQPLQIERIEGIVTLVSSANETLVEARPADLELEVPNPPSYEEAMAASKRYSAYFDRHPYPTCFVCGIERIEGDGLRIFPGPVFGRELVAAPWVPDGSLADATGLVRSEFIWAALDCPGVIASITSAPRPILLGQLTADIRERVIAEERHIVIGWPLARDGRRHLVGSALFSESGQLIARAKATWIEPKTRDV